MAIVSFVDQCLPKIIDGMVRYLRPDAEEFIDFMSRNLERHPNEVIVLSQLNVGDVVYLRRIDSHRLAIRDTVCRVESKTIEREVMVTLSGLKGRTLRLRQPIADPDYLWDNRGSIVPYWPPTKIGFGIRGFEWIGPGFCYRLLQYPPSLVDLCIIQVRKLGVRVPEYLRDRV